MIGLFSYNGDLNTNYLIEWLLYYNVEFKRVNLEDEDFFKLEVHNLNNTFQFKLRLCDGDILDLSQCSFFYVRGAEFKKPVFKNTISLPEKEFIYYMDNEFNSLTKFFYSKVNKRSVGAFYLDSHLNLTHRETNGG